MIVVQDSNIFISALINENGKEFKLIKSAPSTIQFVIPSYLIDEVKNKIEKITSSTRNSEAGVLNN